MTPSEPTTTDLPVTMPEIMRALGMSTSDEQAHAIVSPLSEIACAAIQWAIADRVADTSADLVNALEREERLWSAKLESRGGFEAGPSLTANTVNKIRKEIEIAKLSLADACAHEAACDAAMKRIAKRIASPPPTVAVAKP